MICVFDIETIPDITHIASMYQLEEAQPLALCEHAFALQKERTGSAFLPLYLHRVIAIASVLCDEYGHVIKIGNFGKKKLENLGDLNVDEIEHCLIEEFFHFINAKEPRLVSFNGKGFDMPLLLLKAMRYNCNAFRLFETHNEMRTKNKWENYRARYGEYWHMDLLEALSHHGFVRGLTLDGVCKALGLVGKYDVSGEDVHELFYGKEALEEIWRYCESDVINTYWLYLKYALIKGELEQSDYQRLLENLCEKLDANAPYTHIFTTYINAEITRLSKHS